MDFSSLLIGIIGPTLFWAGYHYCRDRHRPEPTWALVLAYLMGIASGWLGLQGYQLLEGLGLRRDAYLLAEQSLGQLLAYSVLGIGLVEESAKLIPFALLAWRLPQFDDPLDGITYAAFIGLGFASFETLHHAQYMDGAQLWARGLASPLVHVAFASIWGFIAGRAFMAGRGIWGAGLAGLALAALAHGIYDFITIGLGPVARLLAAGLVLVIWLWRMRLVGLWHRRYAT